MKRMFYSFIVGLLVGGGAIYFLLNNSIPAQATMKVTASQPNIKITNKNLEVKTTAKVVKAIASFTSSKKGTFTNTITINRRNLQFKHSIYTEMGYWLNSQLPYFSLSYSYNNLLMSVKVGYSFKLKTIDYGLGIGYKLSF